MKKIRFIKNQIYNQYEIWFLSPELLKTNFKKVRQPLNGYLCKEGFQLQYIITPKDIS